MTGSRLGTRLKAIEQRYKVNRNACGTCRTWNAWYTLYDTQTKRYDPHPPSCPDCDRQVLGCKFIRKELWDAL